MEGSELIKFLSENSGLPTDWVQGQMTSLIDSKGIDPSQITLEDIRVILADCLQEIILEHSKSQSAS